MAVAEERRLKLILWKPLEPLDHPPREPQSKGQTQRLDSLLEQRPLARQNDLTLGFQTRERFGSVLMDVHGLSKSFGKGPLFSELRLAIAPGDRIGIIGPNGCGKSTLIKVIAGQIESDSGEILKTPRLTVGMLDQNRTGLNDGDTVLEAAGNGNDWVHIGINHPVIGFYSGSYLGGNILTNGWWLSGGEKPAFVGEINP